MTTILGDVNQGVQSALNDSLGTNQPTPYNSGVPRVPAPQIPMRPADQAEEPPDQSSGVDTMANLFLSHILQKDRAAAGLDQPAPPQQDQGGPAPGSFASKLQGATSALGAGLGDARSGGDPRQGHGWLSAVSATLNARTERLQKEQQVKFEQDERLKADKINTAIANSQIATQARTMQRQDLETRHSAADAGELYMSHLRDNFDVKDGLSQNELNKMMTSDPKFAQTHTARITSYEPVLDGNGQPKMINGQPVESPLWSVVNIAPDDKSHNLTVTPALAKKWHDAGIKDVTAGTVMPLTVSNQLDAQSQAFGTSLNLLNRDKVTPLSPELKEQMTGALKNPEVAHALAMQPGSTLAGLYAASDNISAHIDAVQQRLAVAQKSGDQNAVAALTEDLQSHQQTQRDLDTTINQGFTPAERSTYQKEVDADRKQTEAEAQNAARDKEAARHNRADEAAKMLAAQGGGSPEILNQVGDKMADAEIVPSDLPKRAKNLPQTWIAADNSSWARYGKPYDVEQAGREEAYAKNTQVQNTLKYLNSLTGGPGVPKGNLDELVSASNRVNRTQFPPINDPAAWVRLKAGDPTIAQYQTVVTEVADQVAKILQGGAGGGGTSDAKLKQAQDLFNTGFTKDQISGIAKELNPLLQNRRQGMIGTNRFLQKDYYGAGGMTVTMVSPDGKNYREVPLSQVPTAQQKGGRIATKQDYAALGLKPSDH